METITTTSRNLQEKFGLDSEPVAINSDLADIFERGVLTSVRVSAERFGFTLRLADLGLVPTRDKSKDKTQAAIDAVLRTTQRASLLAKDEMWYLDGAGNRLPIPRLENTERAIRLLFPTKVEAVQQVDTSAESASRSSSMTTVSSMWAVPMNGMTFVPEASFARWKSELDAAVTAHKNVSEIICSNYDRLRVSSVRHYEHIALDVYNRLRQTSPDQIRDINPLDFTRRWKRAVFRAWPTKETILANFSVDVQYYWAPLPSRIRQERALSEEIESQTRIKRQERRAASEISALVAQSQTNQVQNLTVSYMRTLLERTESVFLNFLDFLAQSDRNPSSTQLNSVLRVIEMINVMGEGVSSFDQIRAQAAQVETLVAQYKRDAALTKDKKALGSSLRAANSQLPEAIANAVEVMRVETESLVGKEGRRTLFTDQNPFELCNAIWNAEDASSSSRVVMDDTEDDTFAQAFQIIEEASGTSGLRIVSSL